LLLAGAAAGGLLTYTIVSGKEPSTSRARSATAGAAGETVVVTRDDNSAELQAEIDRLKALLAERPEPPVNPWPNDTTEAVDALLQTAYADANIDMLLEALRRLLRMGERGYPLLRRVIEDLLGFKFLPTTNSFRMHHIYVLGRLGLEEERHIIGFINYLLTDPDTRPQFKPFAQMAAAYYIGSNAPGAEVLQETLIAMVLQQKGGGLAEQMMGGMGKRIQLFAVAMSGDPRMIAPLRDELSKSGDKREQGEILGALAYLGDPTIVPLVKERINPREGDYMQELDALGRVGTEEAHATATEFLRAIPDSRRFYRHARRYMSAGGGNSAVLLMRDRIKADPGDPEIGATIGALSRYPTKDSRDTLKLIADSSTDKEVQKRAGEAVDEIDRRLRGEMPAMTPGGPPQGMRRRE